MVGDGPFHSFPVAQWNIVTGMGRPYRELSEGGSVYSDGRFAFVRAPNFGLSLKREIFSFWFQIFRLAGKNFLAKAIILIRLVVRFLHNTAFWARPIYKMKKGSYPSTRHTQPQWFAFAVIAPFNIFVKHIYKIRIVRLIHYSVFTFVIQNFIWNVSRIYIFFSTGYLMKKVFDNPELFLSIDVSRWLCTIYRPGKDAGFLLFSASRCKR